MHATEVAKKGYGVCWTGLHAGGATVTAQQLCHVFITCFHAGMACFIRQMRLQQVSPYPQSPADPAVAVQGFGAPESYFSPWGLSNSPDRVVGGLNKLGGALMGTIFSELLQELQHGLDYDQEQQQQEQQYDWHSRMDRFFWGLSDRLGQGLEKHHGDEGSLDEQIQNLQQLLQRELRAMTPPDVINWLHDLTDQEQDQKGKQALLGSDKDSQGQGQPQQQQQTPYPSRRGSSSGAGGEMQVAPAKQVPQEPLLPWQQPSAQAAMRQLEGLGAAVYLPSAAALKAGVEQGDQEQQQWGVLAGYEAQKQALEDCLLLPLKHPEVGGVVLCSLHSMLAGLVAATV
jgi:hypothetical protein